MSVGIENIDDILNDLSQALKAPEPPIENKGNIDLVGKYYDKLAAIMGDDPGVAAGVFTYEVHSCRGFPGDSLP